MLTPLNRKSALVMIDFGYVGFSLPIGFLVDAGIIGYGCIDRQDIKEAVQ
jgi:hypothetical protein